MIFLLDWITLCKVSWSAHHHIPGRIERHKLVCWQRTVGTSSVVPSIRTVSAFNSWLWAAPFGAGCQEPLIATEAPVPRLTFGIHVSTNIHGNASLDNYPSACDGSSKACRGCTVDPSPSSRKAWCFCLRIVLTNPTAVIFRGSGPSGVASMVAILGLEMEMEDNRRTKTSERQPTVPNASR